jgi:hypothetical protein
MNERSVFDMLRDGEFCNNIMYNDRYYDGNHHVIDRYRRFHSLDHFVGIMHLKGNTFVVGGTDDAENIL